MKFMNGRSLVALGAAFIVVSLLAFGMVAPSTTLGQETDVPADPPASLPDDVSGEGEGPSTAPASLPDAGSGAGSGTGFRGGIEGSTLLVIGMLAAIGVTLMGTGMMTSRQTRPTNRS